MEPTAEWISEGFESRHHIEEEHQGGLKCDLKIFESRYNSKGERVVLSVGTRRQLDPPEEHPAHDFALVLTRFYDRTREKELEYTELEIRSPHVKKALKEVVPQYHDIDLRTARIILHNYPTCIFHYRRELEAYGRTLRDTVAIQHLVFILKYMYKELDSDLYNYYSLVEATPQSPRLDFQNLWMVFRPGEKIYTKVGNTEAIYDFKSKKRCKCTLPWCWKSKWVITASFIDYDGINFGYNTTTLRIAPYEGYKALKDLNVVPLEYLPNKELVSEAVISRGKRFIALHGNHHKSYNGIAKMLPRDTSLDEEFLYDNSLYPNTLVFRLQFGLNDFH
jgi:hypothetical protein